MDFGQSNAEIWSENDKWPTAISSTGIMEYEAIYLDDSGHLLEITQSK